MPNRRGFTLIELSIVLVIIGLLIGGVLVGRDLIAAATIRATIAQLEKYNTAVNTFRTKYNALPGDIKTADAAALGLYARAGGVGDGDGNDMVEGYGGDGSGVVLGGETVFFWTDLAAANLIDGSFTQSTDAAISTLCCTGTKFAPYFPAAKTGRKAYIIAFENWNIPGAIPGYKGLMFAVTQPVNSLGAGRMNGTAAMSVIEAYSIDAKIDDGQPHLGTLRGGGASNGSGGVGLFSAFDMSSTSNFCVSDAVPNGQYFLTYPDNVNCSLLVEAH